jgi:hypothetical protein
MRGGSFSSTTSGQTEEKRRREREGLGGLRVLLLEGGWWLGAWYVLRGYGVDREVEFIRDTKRG